MGAPGDPLWLDPETMRDLGYRAVDAVVDILHESSAPPVRRATAAEMDERVPSGVPEGPSPFDELHDRVSSDVRPDRSRHDHAGFFGVGAGGGTFPGARGDFLASRLK